MGVLALYLDLFAFKVRKKKFCTDFFPISLDLKGLIEINLICSKKELPI